MINLRVRTAYSFRNAAGMLPNVAARLIECGQKYGPITDRSNTFGWVRWTKECKAAGLVPIYGVELGVSPNPQAKKPVIDYWTFIATDNIVAINKLVELATQQFRYEPLLTYQQALAAPDMIKIMGSRVQLDQLATTDPAQHPVTYMGLAPSTPPALARRIAGAGWPLLACSDNRYPGPDDFHFYELICGRAANDEVYPQHILCEAEYSTYMADRYDQAVLSQAIANTEGLLDQCTATLRNATLVKPEKKKTLEQMCREGAAKLDCDLTDPVYAERLKRELDLIAQKDFEDYFYIVADICQWAREHMFVGPARGSSCGSLVCYLLRITTVDPIPHGLIFERFIDITRDDLPDIDIDFSDQQRGLVFDYIKNKYGADRVARLGTVALYRPRSALQEGGAALKIPRWMCDKVADSLIERRSGDRRALQTLEDTFTTTPAGQAVISEYPEAMVLSQMEGHPRHYSQHAAGIVISEEPIHNYVATDHRTGAAMCDKKDAEDLNLLKIDALGLTQLSIFEDALALAGLPLDTLEKLPLDDKAAFEVLNKQHYSGIFQFNGIAVQAVVKQIKVESFEDIAACGAVARPGPLGSGAAQDWVNRRNGNAPITYVHPVFEPDTRETFGIVLYQEQVMNIGRNVGGLSWGEVAALRKTMSKSLGKEYFDQYGDPWKKGAMARGVPEKDANKVWDDLCAYGSWSFNKSHAVAYGLISYYCCWLKAHYPHEFAAASLTHEKDPARQIELLREMAQEGIEYVSYDPEVSTNKWLTAYRDNRKVLVGPLTNIKGIGPKMVANILAARSRGEPLTDRARKLLADATTPIDSLWPIRDRFAQILPDPKERNIHTPPIFLNELEIKPEKYQAVVLCTFSRINVRDENEVINVARRGYEYTDGMTTSLNLQMTDDTDTVFGKINRYKYEQLGKAIVARGRPGKALYAVKGTVTPDLTMRMMFIEQVKYIGDMDPSYEENA